MNVYEINYQDTGVEYVYIKSSEVLAETFEIALVKLKLVFPKITIIGGRLIAMRVIL